ncbi:hypothetical protein JX266_013549 [Neoarthrinium moseri]|nr:hypothetical protein JX266_013549 [Neoarthrinium moseri]
MKLVSFPNSLHYIILGYHHIDLDGNEFQIFFTDLEKAYNGNLDTSGAGLLQYPKFALMEKREYDAGQLSTQITWWRTWFANLPPPLPLLSLCRKSHRPAALSFSSHDITLRLEPNLNNQVSQCCQRLEISSFYTYLTVFKIFLFRHKGDEEEEMCIGIADGNRKHPDVLGTIGLFLNLLPLRFDFDPYRTFVESLNDVKNIVNKALDNSDIPFEVLLAELGVPRSSSHTPLFQAFFDFRQGISESRQFLGCDASGETTSAGKNAYDISLDVVDSKGREDLLTLRLNTGIYTADDAKVLAMSYKNLVESFSRNPATRVTWPPLYVQDCDEAWSGLGQGPVMKSGWAGTLVHRIQAMAHRYGSKVALQGLNQNQLTYDQMMGRVKQISCCLSNQGVGNESTCAILPSPGPDWVCSCLAVFCHGAIAVPLEPQVFSDRLLTISKNCHLGFILVDNSVKLEPRIVQDTPVQLINVSRAPRSASVLTFTNRSKSSKIPVIAYKSGSTGIPKGVTITHDIYRNFIEFAPCRWGIKEGEETILQQSACSFDMSLAQMFTSLAYGGTLVIPESYQSVDPEAICQTIVSAGVTVTFATATEYLTWIQVGTANLRRSQWQTAITGGEPLTASLLHAFRSLSMLNLSLTNAYGPAEVTFSCADSIITYTQSCAPDFPLKALYHVSCRLTYTQLSYRQENLSQLRDLNT